MVIAACLWCRKSLEGHEFEAGLRHPTTGKLSLSTKQQMGTFFESGKDKASTGEEWASFVFNLPCPRYSGTLTAYTHTAIPLLFYPFWKAFVGQGSQQKVSLIVVIFCVVYFVVLVFVALRPWYPAMAMSGRPVNIIALFLGILRPP